jgi:RHS repeat-associated protein
MVARSVTNALGGLYRYGFNGMEHNDETVGGDYDFGARIYDSRICRWLALDKIVSTSVNRYCFVENNPIYYLDKDGKFAIVVPIAYGVAELLVLIDAAFVATVVTVTVNETVYNYEELDRSKLRPGIIQPTRGDYYKFKPANSNDPNFKFNNGGKFGAAGLIIAAAGYAIRAYNVKLSDGTKVGEKLYDPAIENISKYFEDNHLDIISSTKNTTKQFNVISTNEVYQITHVIQPSENLSMIAQKFNTTVDILLELNPGIKDADVIKAGQAIVIDKVYIDTTTEVNPTTKEAKVNVKVENQKQRKDRINNIKKVVAKYKK